MLDKLPEISLKTVIEMVPSEGIAMTCKRSLRFFEQFVIDAGIRAEVEQERRAKERAARLMELEPPKIDKLAFNRKRSEHPSPAPTQGIAHRRLF